MMKHTLLIHTQIPCMPVQWREDWTKHWEMNVTLITGWPWVSYMSVCRHKCVCICNVIKRSKPLIFRDFSLKNFFFLFLSPGVDIHMVTQSPRLLPPHGSALLKSSP